MDHDDIGGDMSRDRSGDHIYYRDGIPYFNDDCSACVSGDWVDETCPACRAMLEGQTSRLKFGEIFSPGGEEVEEK